MIPTNIEGFRYSLVTGIQNRKGTVQSICNIFRLSRRSAYKWLNRFIKEGLQGLKNKLRAPKNVWNKKSKEIEDNVCSLFRQGDSVEEIYLKLIDNLCEKTIYNILKRNGLPRKTKKKRKYKRYEYKEPNQMWHTDFTEFRIKNHGKFYIVAVLDDHSRFITGFGVFEKKTAENCLAVLRESVENHGLPEAMLTDNGKQFVAKLYNDFLDKKGIKHRRTRPYNPQCNGKIERWFRTLKKPLRKKWFNNPDEFIREVGEFVDKYNNKPKRVLKWRTPKEKYI